MALTPNKKNAKELDSIKFDVLEIRFLNGDILSVEQKISKRGIDNPNKDWESKEFLNPQQYKYNYIKKRIVCSLIKVMSITKMFILVNII